MQSQTPVEVPAQTTEPFQNQNGFPPHKKHYVVKILAWFFVVIIGAPLVFIVLINILGAVYHDSAPQTYPSLALKTVSIPQVQNAYFDMLHAGAQMSVISSATSTVAQKSAAKGAVYSAFIKAAQKPAYQDTVSSNPNTVSVNSLLPPLGDFRSAAILNDVYAKELAQNGKASQALTQALATVLVGNKMTSSQGEIIEYLVEGDIEKRGLNTLRIIATSTTSSDVKILIKTASALNGKSDDGSGLAKAFKLNWYMFSSNIRTLPVTGMFLTSPLTVARILTILAPSFYWHKNDNIGYLATSIQKNVQDALASCTLVKRHSLAPVQAVSNNSLWYFTSNGIGKMLHSNWLSADNQVDVWLKQTQCNNQTLLGATQLTLALRAYQIDHHTLPASLSELVPNYLSVLPLDPYSGKSFQYSQSRGVIHSVGYKGKHSLSSSSSDSSTTFSVK